MKAAKDMFNPENMKKYAALGQKIQALQEELGQTEVEVATNEGAILVKITAMQEAREDAGRGGEAAPLRRHHWA